MTDIPEHLLRRSKERRSALGGGASGSEPPAAPGEAPGSGAAAGAVEPAGGAEVATPAAAAVPVEAAPEPLPPYVEASRRRPRVPRFAIPVLAALPVWALVYAGALTKPAGEADPELAMGATVYAAQCSGCHGANGEGGTGRPLGDLMKVFPNKADQIAWVHLGSPEKGTPYGDPAINRKAGEGGYGVMPPFKDALSGEEIAAVVRYEREHFAGSAPEPSTAEDIAGSGETTAASGHPPSGSGGSQASGANPSTSGGSGAGGGSSQGGTTSTTASGQ